MNKQKIISLIERYRILLYFFHHQPSIGLMPKGVPCQVEDPEADITHGDVVHPCVRYIEEGFEGHQWWMVYTPFYGGDDHMENPRLCYADSDNNTPPTKWKHYCIVKGQPQTGYNSDPTLLYHKGELYVFWRECHTETTDNIGCNYATFGCVVRNRVPKPLPKALLPNVIGEVKRSHDREISPTFWVVGNKLKAFALHQKFDPDFVSCLPTKLARILYRYSLFFLSDALGLYNKIQNRGVAIWEGESFNSQFQYSETVKIKNVSRLYQPWHMDLFQKEEDEKTLYAIVQTSEYFADICLASCDDNRHFRLFRKPLLTSRTIGMSGLYKSTALIVGDDLHLYYTALDNQDPKLNKLFVTTTNWNALLYSIQ
jgi:hypothetical protein